jgi:hypothetical protein
MVARLGGAVPAGRLLLRGAVLPGSGGVLVRPRSSRVDGNIPGHVPGRVCHGLQRGQQPPPGAVPLPAAEQAIDRLPGAVLRRDVPPRGTDPDPPADPVDEPPPAPLWRPAYAHPGHLSERCCRRPSRRYSRMPVSVLRYVAPAATLTFVVGGTGWRGTPADACRSRRPSHARRVRRCRGRPPAPAERR